ncbi:MAG: DUF1624 domain-containing protein [Bacteroidetes bacterium]|nr:DUF1624 domain-containing protein [Bacteroidota bacterium]
MSARTLTADVLKGIAVLLMIQVHLVELFASPDIFVSHTGKLLLFLGGPPVAPVFMILFGYFMFSSDKSTGQLMWRGLKILALGMLLNLALNAHLLWAVYKGAVQVDVWSYVFGVDILPFAGLGLLVIAPLQKVMQQHPVVVLFMILVAIFTGHYLMNYLPENNVLKYLSAFIYGSTEWSYFPLLPWIAYPLSGIALYQLQRRYDFSFFYLPKTRLLFGITFFLFFVFTFQYAVSVSSDLLMYYHHGALFFLWVLLFVVFYALLIDEFYQRTGETWVSRYLSWLGRNLTFVYVVQWIIIGNIATGIYKTVSSPLYLACWFAGITIVTSGLVYLLLWVKRVVLSPAKE